VKQKQPQRSQKRRNFYGKANKESLQPLDRVIEKFLSVNRMNSKLDEVDVVLAWKEVFGEVINKKTRHLMLKASGELVATLNSGPLKEEFNLNKDKVAAMLNTHMQRDVVKSVRIR
tara:strand:- start:612 stop:959 length:348 start_codon:yes stop_codon:yes gene_type:complete